MNQILRHQTGLGPPFGRPRNLIGRPECVAYAAFLIQYPVTDAVLTQGEVDIVEGVNDQTPNAATLHTTSGNDPIVRSYDNHSLDRISGCTMPSSRTETGFDCPSAFHFGVSQTMAF